jgi:hypothetical protein
VDANGLEERYVRITRNKGSFAELLTANDLEYRYAFYFDNFLQMMLSFRPEWLDKNELAQARTFFERLPIGGKTAALTWKEAISKSNATTATFSALASNLLPKSSATKTLIKALQTNLGCVEHNPYLPQRLRIPRKTTQAPTLAYCSNTFVASSPHYPSSDFLPPRVRGPHEKARFRRLHAEILRRNFGLDLSNLTLFNRDDPELVEIVLSELYSNITQHAVAPPAPLIAHKATLRMVRYMHIPVSSPLLGSSEECEGIESRYLKSVTLGNRKLTSLVTISIFDNGPGIARHFACCKKMEEREVTSALFEKIILSQLSATRTPGSGLGIRNAVDAVLRMSGLISVRCNNFWACIHSGHGEIELINPGGKSPHNVEGTSYKIVFPRFAD